MKIPLHFLIILLCTALPVIACWDPEEGTIARRNYLRDAYTELLEARLITISDELEGLYSRTGRLARLNNSDRKEAKKFIDKAQKDGKIGLAATRGSSAKTIYTDKKFHLDRQLGQGADGTFKVAVQLTTNGQKGRPKGSTTVAQVQMKDFPQGKQPPPERVAKALKQSLKTGREKTVPFETAKQIAHRERLEAQKKRNKVKKNGKQYKFRR
ncbi:hypothetical protein CC1G_11802 [Coprinopsis cinerea okayama7|uniref:Uncharacterized protein n=1 Tax=Coprinopsis cinerea (strain Okayama-7 / 130 / ATCC MYA-4618 / FGSC 9003) TaxID=240176 RepID=A8N809_COPC7|nr:hypothetical protein CC1G_11802 [Coprinopsis cinerea okayama7\|eukprot:XP_001830965.1 hypothetical protein CC1G_11802 [Coprinopsis cinerea okayama7\